MEKDPPGDSGSAGERCGERGDDGDVQMRYRAMDHGCAYHSELKSGG